MTEDTIMESAMNAPLIDTETGRVYLRSQNGRVVVIKTEALIEQLAQLNLLDEIAADQMARLNLPGSGPAKKMAKVLAEAFRDMRTAQKDYFRHKSQVDLKEAVRLEKIADTLIENYFKIADLI